MSEAVCKYRTVALNLGFVTGTVAIASMSVFPVPVLTKYEQYSVVRFGALKFIQGCVPYQELIIYN